MMQATQPGCRFCAIIAGAEPVTTVAPGVVSFPTMEPTTLGHVLVIPKAHVADATEDPAVTGRVFAAASRVARQTGQPCNLITNVGAEAGQKVFHLHVHVVPRFEGGPLQLPGGERLRTRRRLPDAVSMWRYQWYRNLWYRLWAWQDRSSPGLRTCAHGRQAGWDYLDGGWWHTSDWSECADGEPEAALPPRMERRYGPALRPGVTKTTPGRGGM